MNLKNISLAAALAVASLLNLPAPAAEINYGYVSKGASGTTSAEVIFPANTEKTLRLTCLDAQTDLPTATLKLFGGTERYTVLTAALSTVTNLIVATNLNAASNDVVVIQKANGTTFSATVWGTSGTTNILFTAQLGTAVSAGDYAYRMSNIRTLYPAGTNELRISGEAIFAAQLRNPVLVRLTGTSACRLNNAVAHYDASE